MSISGESKFFTTNFPLNTPASGLAEKFSNSNFMVEVFRAFPLVNEPLKPILSSFFPVSVLSKKPSLQPKRALIAGVFPFKEGPTTLASKKILPLLLNFSSVVANSSGASAMNKLKSGFSPSKCKSKFMSLVKSILPLKPNVAFSSSISVGAITICFLR